MPIERTLHISNKPCNKYFTQSGGNPTNIIKSINNNQNKYLFFDNCEDEMTFDEKLNKNTDIGNSTYLGKGGSTAVFAILNKSNCQFILRIEEQKTTNDLNKFIEQWKEDKILFPQNIIEIYAYGVAMVNNIPIGTYTITDKYNDFDKLLNLNLSQKNIFTANMLKFLVALNEHNIYYRDFKLPNIGFDEKFNFIVLDYDNITLIRKNSSFFTDCLNLYKITNPNKNAINALNKKINICYGTLLPLISKFNHSNEFRNTNYSKYYCLALADILLNIYMEPTQNAIEFDKEIYTQPESFEYLQTQNSNEKIEIIKPETYNYNTMETDTEYSTMVYRPIEKVGGNTDVQSIYLNNLKNKIDGLTPNFKKNECNLCNVPFELNFYDNLLQFIKTTLINMINPDSNKIMTEQQILKCFKNAFCAMPE